MFDHISQPHPAAQANAHAGTLAQAKTTTAGKFRTALHTSAPQRSSPKNFSMQKITLNFLKTVRPPSFNGPASNCTPPPSTPSAFDYFQTIH